MNKLADQVEQLVVNICDIWVSLVTHRWIENVPAIERILDILPNFKQHVKCMDEKKLKIRVQNRLNCFKIQIPT